MSYRANSKRIEGDGAPDGRGRKTAPAGICIELRDTLDGLNRDTHPEDAMSFGTGDGQNMFFVNRILNHDFYDGLICSGRISLLKPDLNRGYETSLRTSRSIRGSKGDRQNEG